MRILILLAILVLPGCTGAELAGGAAAVLGGGYAAYQQAPGSPTEGPILPLPPTPGTSLWYYLGAGNALKHRRWVFPG